MTYTVEINPEAWKNSLLEGLKASVSTAPRAAVTLLSGLLIFTFTILLSNPAYSFEMFTAGTQYWSLAVQTRFYSVLVMSGVTGLLLTSMFSLLAGVAFTNTGVKLTHGGFGFDALGAVPGFAAAGCATCGVGVLSILGLGAVMAALPFNGNLLRLGAVLLLAAIIARTGDPEVCRLN